MPFPRITLKKRKALPFFSRHPWVFSGAIARIERDPDAGSVVDLYSDRDEFIARGLFNPHSNIKVRLYSWNKEEELDQQFWQQRIQTAISKRRMLFDLESSTSACRLIFSEADQLSGVIVDRYGDWLLVQWTSRALLAFQDIILESLQELLQPKGIWQRTEKGIGKSEGLEISDGLIAGEPPPQPLLIEEGPLTFEVDVVAGQKTGFYLDQRDNRALLGEWLSRVPGQRVLDLFCYSGGFGLAATVIGQAGHVTAVDVSEPAISLARRNAERHDVEGRFEFRTEKVFPVLEELKARGERFDTVILDPPKMTRHRSGLSNALRGYHSLNALAVELLNPGGLLVTCSCSGLIDRDSFEALLTDVSLSTDLSIAILDSRGPSADHPTSVFCNETRYLKCCFCSVE